MSLTAELAVSVWTDVAAASFELIPSPLGWAEEGEEFALSVGKEVEEEEEEEGKWRECGGCGDCELSLSERGGLGVLTLELWHITHLLARLQFSYVHFWHFHFFWWRLSADDFLLLFDLSGLFGGESLT